MSGTGKDTTMERPSIRTLSNRAVNAVKVEKDTVFWDRHLTGFGVRVYPTGGKVYIAQARGPEGPKRLTVGRHGVLGAEQARRRAAGIIARIKAGESPVAEPAAASASGPTVAEVAKRYLDEHVAVRYKPGSATLAGGVVNRYIVPEFGKKRMIEVERSEVLALHQRLCKAPSAANPGRSHAVADVHARRGLGRRARGDESVSIDHQVPAAQAGAVLDGSGVRPSGDGCLRKRKRRAGPRCRRLRRCDC